MINLLQQALNRRRLLQGGAALGATAALGGLRLPAASAQDAPPLPTDASDMDALIAGAQKENKIVSYGMPREWANLGEMWDTFKSKYNIKDWEDTDMGSATEIAKFLAEKDNPVSDIGDIGILFAPTAVSFGVAAPFKNDTWDKIPDWAKHPDGTWATQYYGAMAFWINTDLIENVPHTWQDLLKPEYKGLVSLNDPRTATQGNFAVIAAAFANGGDETNIQPGLDFFKKVAEAGNLGPTGLDLANLQKGETALAIGWDYNGLNTRDALTGQANIEVLIPEDGSTVGPYVSIINQWAPPPVRRPPDAQLHEEIETGLDVGFVAAVRERRRDDGEVALGGGAGVIERDEPFVFRFDDECDARVGSVDDARGREAADRRRSSLR